MVYALMEIQNIVQTLLTMAAISGRKINKMDEIRLIDVNDVYKIIGQTGTARVHVADIDQIKRIAPETLPIVRELREKLEQERKICDHLQCELVQVAKERDEALQRITNACEFCRSAKDEALPMCEAGYRCPLQPDGDHT